MSSLDLKSLYKIPWSTNNNANGWIEPTTYCQLKCPGCYRGLNNKNHVPVHFPLKDMKKHVDLLIEKRNVQTISIAGGEPLMYPYLDDLVSYISDKEIFSVVLTNGILINEKRLKELKTAGLGKVVIHIDRFQGHENGKTELEVNKIRSEFCDLFRKVEGLQLGFIMPVSVDNVADIPVLSSFMKMNADIVDTIIFTIYRENLADTDLNNAVSHDSNYFFYEIKKAFDIEYCAYIPKLHNDDIAWLFSTTMYRSGRYWGKITAREFETIQQKYYQEYHKYLYIPSNNESSLMQDYGLNFQTLIIVNPPVMTPKGWNLCAGCPDAMFHDGKIVPSCLLERIKLGENIYLK